MVAVAEAAAVAGAPDLDTASHEQMVRAWGLVSRAATIDEADLAAEIAKQAGIRVADLAGADARATILLPAEVAWRRTVFPLDCTEREVRVATSNPLSQDAKREIASITSRTVRFEVAAPVEIVEAIQASYGADEESSGPEPPRPETRQPAGPHILVVDDEPGQRALLRSLLEEDGYRVTLALDGADAMRLLDAGGDFDLVTLDYWMDKVNGLRVLQHLRSTSPTPGVPVIVVTGSDDRRIEMSLFEAGADDYIAKPVDGPLFLLRVHAVLRRRRLS